jgi:hypothetical protein
LDSNTVRKQHNFGLHTVIRKIFPICSSQINILFSVFMTVSIIYCIVIIYVPSLKELQTDFQVIYWFLITVRVLIPNATFMTFLKSFARLLDTCMCSPRLTSSCWFRGRKDAQQLWFRGTSVAYQETVSVPGPPVRSGVSPR